MCRKSNIHFGGLIYLIFLFVLLLGLVNGQAWGQPRVIYWDENFRTCWADEAVTIAIRDHLENAGYEILDAYQLKTFMNARIADGMKSVIVFCRDNVPDTIVESMSANCTLRRYLDAGGKIIWHSDIPFWGIAHSDGTNTYWGGDGCANVLGILGVDCTNDTGVEVTLTDDGIDWGLTRTWNSQSWTPADQVDIVLASGGNGNAAAWVKHFVPGDTTGGFVRIWDCVVSSNSTPCLEDLLAVAEYGIGSKPYTRDPYPADGSMYLKDWIRMTWNAGDFAVSYNVYFGDNFDDVNNGSSDTFWGNIKWPFFIAGSSPYPYQEGLVYGKTYYWRIDEVNDADPNSPWRGDVWSFWLPPKNAYDPVPSDSGGFVDAESPVLSWTPGVGAISHTVYFGDDYDVVSNATEGRTSSLTTFIPGPLELARTYYWRVDEYYDSFNTYKGDVWSFTTADFAIVDDFEDYGAGDNRIIYSWHDGIGYGDSIDPPYLGNGTGSMVGDENTSSYTEETIVHSGRQSMPYWYDNNKPDHAYYSEAELTLTAPRDWTEEGLTELSLWFCGLSTNDAEPLYVAVSNITGTTAIVVHDDPYAATIDTWKEWVIPLQTFADQGVVLTDVDRITIGLGIPDNMTIPGGSGKIFFDDIRLYLPRQTAE